MGTLRKPPKTKTVVIEVQTALTNRTLCNAVFDVLTRRGGAHGDCGFVVTQRPKVLTNQPPVP